MADVRKTRQHLDDLYLGIPVRRTCGWDQMVISMERARVGDNVIDRVPMLISICLVMQIRNATLDCARSFDGGLTNLDSRFKPFTL